MAIQNVLIGCVCKTVLDCQPTIIKLFEQEFNCDGLTVQNSFAHTTNQNI